jgi:putative ABC transport system ATP-binding protein
MTTAMTMTTSMPIDPADPVVEMRACALRLGDNGQGGDVACVFPSLRVQPGERVAVTGPSGCGKSTCLNVISGLLPLDRGDLRVCGQNLRALRPAALDAFRGRHIGFVHQSFHLLKGFNVLDNVLVGLRFSRTVPARERKRRALEILDRVGLSHRLHAQPQRLSVGERQRVAVARALASHPALLLADEPTGSLDPATADRVVALLETLCADLGCAWICVTHDERIAARFPRRIDASAWVRSQGPAEAA